MAKRRGRKQRARRTLRRMGVAALVLFTVLLWPMGGMVDEAVPGEARSQVLAPEFTPEAATATAPVLTPSPEPTATPSPTATPVPEPQEITITRVAITTEADAEKKGTEMGRKYIVPYGLYRVEGYVSANLARKTTGFSEEDLQLLWEAILNMFENDHSAARGKMAVRELIVFKHDCELGRAPAHKLFDLVTAAHKEGVTAPRSYDDYIVNVDEAHLPEGVTCTRMG